LLERAHYEISPKPHKDVDPEEWGRELGVLKPYGSVAEVED
jgi:hypothetical protein